MLVRLAIEPAPMPPMPPTPMLWVELGVLAALWLRSIAELLMLPVTLTAVDTRDVKPSKRLTNDVAAALVILWLRWCPLLFLLLFRFMLLPPRPPPALLLSLVSVPSRPPPVELVAFGPPRLTTSGELRDVCCCCCAACILLRLLSIFILC